MSKKKLLVLLLISLAVIAGGIFAWKKWTQPTTKYRVEKVKRGNVAVSILSTGTVQPENRVDIKPPIAGRVEQVLVSEGQKVKKGQILAWMSSTERAAMLDAAKSQGPEELKRWEANYRATPVLAPINGTIILRNTESGQTFTANDAILVMSDRLTVKAQVDETDLAQIKLKQPATITLDAYPAQPIEAIVDTIAFDAKTVNNVTTYVVDVLPVKTPDFMRSGMTANVSFLITSHSDVLLVPSDSVKPISGSPKKFSIIVRNEDGKPEKRDVQTDISDGKFIEIVSGLKEGDEIMTPLSGKVRGQGPGGANPFSPMGGGRGRGR